MDLSSNTTSRRGPYNEANKLDNVMVTSKRYIEQTKTLMHNNKAMKTSEYLEKG